MTISITNGHRYTVIAKRKTAQELGLTEQELRDQMKIVYELIDELDREALSKKKPFSETGK